MVDPESIRNRLARLRVLVGVLDEIHERGRDALTSDLHRQLEAERALQLAIQICIDVGAHIVAERGATPPGDYRGVFASLKELGLDPELARALSNGAGQRNILVHDYLEIDQSEIWAAIERLDDLRAFAVWAAEQAGD